LDVGLYNDDGDVHIIEDIVIRDEETRVDVSSCPEAFGPVKAIFVNQGEHAYAKVRFDQDSIQWFIKNLNKVKDSTTRGAIWRYFWMSVMEKSMKSTEFIDFIVNQLPQELEERILMTGLVQLRSLINDYLPVELVEEKKAALFDAIFGVLLKGTATLEPMADQLFGFISTEEQIGKAIQWLKSGKIEDQGRLILELKPAHKHSILKKYFTLKDVPE